MQGLPSVFLKRFDTSFCRLTCSVKLQVQSEDDPIGWFELEEDWNDVEIKLQQCRVAKVYNVLRLVTHFSFFNFHHHCVIECVTTRLFT